MWPSSFERSKTLRLATIGRKTRRRHEVTVNFVVGDGRLFVTTRDNNRDWVQNLLKNPSCEVTISKVTRKMMAVVVQSADERETVRQLYRRKYGILYRLRPPPKESIVYELRPARLTRSRLPRSTMSLTIEASERQRYSITKL